jgi:uncharacterized protein (DUF1697 family)
MPTYIALLRSVNVGGTGKLPMTVLKELCNKAGLSNVRTYIASGNVIFTSPKKEAEIKAALESALKRHASKPVSVFVRTAAELSAVLAENPFPDKPSGKTVAIFLDTRPPKNTPEKATGKRNEEIMTGQREIYVYYPDGIGRSKLKIPAAQAATARNMNTVAKLAELASKS